MTLFEKIIARELPADFVHEDDHCVAFRDIHPAAPTHILVVPRTPIPSITELEPDDAALVGHLFVVAKQIAEQHGLGTGYRLVFNVGEDGQQTVPHLHLHLLGGRTLMWPPG
ncbi:MAG: histidine triad nucleotide-binding protein [Bacteroidota bacterium]